MESLRLTKTSQPNNELSTVSMRNAWLMNKITAGELLKPGAPVLNQQALEVLLFLYAELYDEIGHERFEAAYTHVLKTSKFRPDISELRVAAGATFQSDFEREAMAAFQVVIAEIRQRTVTLRPLGGNIIRDKDENGRYLENPIRAPLRKFEGFPKPIQEALERMGWGDWRKGVEVIGEHPAVAEQHEEGGWMLKTAEQIETRWKQCWKGGK